MTGTDAPAELDNVVWHSLVGPRSHLGERRGESARFDPGVSAFAGLPDEAPPSAWADLADLDELDHAEAAEIMKVDRRAFRKYLSCAKSKLRARAARDEQPLSARRPIASSPPAPQEESDDDTPARSTNPPHSGWVTESPAYPVAACDASVVARTRSARRGPRGAAGAPFVTRPPSSRAAPDRSP